jgi:hypothetical protein
MRIYPGRHQIQQVDKVNLNTDIPLAFIDTNYKDYVVNILPKFSSDKMDVVVPYSEFASLDVCLFDKNRNLLNNTSLLQRDRDKYYYVPQKAVTFNPQRFNYSVVGKRCMTYRMDKQYNIKVGCIDNETLDFSKLLIKVFGDAADRQLCPQNIAVNNKDISVQSLSNSSIAQNDFVFMRSTDGNLDKYTGKPIDINQFVNNHTNLWISVDTFPYTLLQTSTKPELKLSSPVLYNDLTLPDKIFDLSAVTKKDEITIHNIFNDTYSTVLIQQYKDKGFVIITPAGFLDNINTNVKLFYEILMYVYLQSYCVSDTINDWIADTVPDFIAMNNKLIQKDKFTSSMEYYRLLDLSSEEVNLVGVNITPDNVKFSGLSNNYIVFRKDISGTNAQYSDPGKPAGAISVFTPRQNIIYYQDFVYNIEDNIQEKISWEFDNNNLIFSIKPFVNTLNDINITLESNLSYRLFKVIDYKEQKITEAIVYLVCKENILNLISKETYKDTDGIIIAEIQITQSDNISQIYDMRQRGGGYPDNTNPSVSCLMDIGNMSGSAYRKAGTFVITLPKRLQKYEELITKVIDKHMVAEELPIILFEDKEE